MSRIGMSRALAHIHTALPPPPPAPPPRPAGRFSAPPPAPSPRRRGSSPGPRGTAPPRPPSMCFTPTLSHVPRKISALPKVPPPAAGNLEPWSPSPAEGRAVPRLRAPRASPWWSLGVSSSPSPSPPPIPGSGRPRPGGRLQAGTRRTELWSQLRPQCGASLGTGFFGGKRGFGSDKPRSPGRAGEDAG